MERPRAGEYHPSYQRYLDLVPPGDFLAILRRNSEDTVAFFEAVPAEKHGFRYAPGKWTIKEVLMHVIDNERVFACRALAASRGDESPFYRMDEELYARNVDVGRRGWPSLLGEFKAVRLATEILFENMEDDGSRRPCNVVTHPMTARAIGYFLIGHARHHIGVIRDRYLGRDVVPDA